MNSFLTNNYEFADFRVETADKTLWRGEEKIPLPIKAVEVLMVLIENRGRTVLKEELMERVWQETFVDENNLAVMISKLRKALADGVDGAKFIDTVPRRGYRFTGTLIASAESEVIIERVTSTAVSIEQLVEREPTRWLVLVGAFAGVVLVGLIGIFIVTRGVERPSSSAPIVVPQNSIAVLPFANVTREPGDEALAVGLSDVLVSKLSSVPGLSINAMSANAANALDGSIQRSGSKLRISYKIVRAADKTVRFAETIDVEDTSLLEVQERIARNILTTLVSSLTESERNLFVKKETQNEKAYALYLNANYAVSKRSTYDIHTAIKLFTKASELDQEFALPLVGIARCYMILGDSAIGEINPVEAAKKARPFVDRALAINPNLAEALSILGTIRLNLDWNIEAAEALLRRSIEANPNIVAPRQQLAWLLIAKEDYAGADREFREALRVDPTSQILQTEVGYANYFGGDLESAEADFRNAVELDPRAISAQFNLWRVLHERRKYVEASALLDTLEAQIGNTYSLFRFCRARSLKALGDVAKAESIYAELQADEAFSPLFMAILAADMEKKEDAFKYLNTSFEQRNDYLLHLGHSPEFANLRSDPRFSELRRRIAAAKVE